MILMRWTLFIAVALAAPMLPAATYDWTPGLDVVGTERYVRTRHEDTLLDVARRNGFGYDELRLANPTVDPWIPGEGTTVLLPGRYLLPPEPRAGIVINLDEQRLYFFPPSDPAPKPALKKSGKKPVAPVTRRVVTFPISVGREGLETPLTTTTVLEKVAIPVWYPGEIVLKEHAEAGNPLPRAVPPGPDNPLGPLAMKLGIPGVLIHGTNKPYGIGMPVTHGCIRMYPEDIEALMPQVDRGTAVRIVRERWKSGWRNGVLYVEVQASPSADPAQDFAQLERVVGAALASRAGYDVDWAAAENVLLRPRGLPHPIGRQAATGG